MPKVIARTGRLAIAAAFLCLSVALPRNATGQDYPSPASGRYARPDQAGESANDYGRYSPPAAVAAGNAAVPAGDTNTPAQQASPPGQARLGTRAANYDRSAAATTQAWPEESPQRTRSAANEAGAGVPHNRFRAGGPGRALPLRFEPASTTGHSAKDGGTGVPASGPYGAA